MSRAIYVLTQEQLIDLFDQAQKLHTDYEQCSYRALSHQCEHGHARHIAMNRMAPFGRDEFGCALTREAWKIKTVEALLSRYDFVRKAVRS